MAYLLDTNTWIQYLKQPGSSIQVRLAALQPANVITCSVVRSELLHGAEKYGNRDKRVAKVIQTLAPFRSVPFDDRDAIEYARIRHELELSGLGYVLESTRPKILWFYDRWYGVGTIWTAC